MEAFSLLKYWRGGGGGLGASSHATSPAPTATVLTSLPQHENVTDSDDDTGDDGPFFDLEFTVPDEVDDSEENSNANNSGSSNSEHHSEEEEEEEEEDDEDDDNIEECERAFKFTLSPSSNDRGDSNLSLSPSDDLFFKGKLVQVEPSSLSEPNSKPQFTASLFKSATKFRVFMLGLKKPRPNSASSDKKDSNNGSDSVPKQPETTQRQPESQKKQQPERKHFTVKFKVEEVKIMSLFSRDNSSRGNSKSQNQKHNPEDSPSSSEEKRSSKEVMNKYLKMVKPLYIRVSRRYSDKLGFSGHLSLSSSGGKAAPPPPRDTVEKKGSPAKATTEADTAAAAGENRETNTKSEKQGNNLQGGLRVVCKRLGKSRSASSAVAAAPPAALLSSKRRDDSLLQQQDGIQGAIMHCKRSFNASRSGNLFFSKKQKQQWTLDLSFSLELIFNFTA